MKQNILFIILFCLSTNIHAQNRQRFDGGIMVHTGYLQEYFSALDYEAQGITFGLDGALRFHLGNHFRLGGEGYVSTMKQMDNGIYSRTSWSGLLADAYWQFGRWQPYVGVIVGGGITFSLLMFEGSAEDCEAETDAFLHSELFFFVNPNIGVEYALSEAVHLTLKVDRLFPVSSIEMPKEIRCYLGFVFAH